MPFWEKCITLPGALDNWEESMMENGGKHLSASNVMPVLPGALQLARLAMASVNSLAEMGSLRSCITGRWEINSRNVGLNVISFQLKTLVK